MGFLVYWKFLMKIPPKKSKSKINSTTGLFPKRPTILLKLGFTNKLTKFPGDSSRDLCIPDRWRSLYPLKGHLTIESHGNQQFQSVVFRLFSRRFYLFNEGQKNRFTLTNSFPVGLGSKSQDDLGNQQVMIQEAIYPHIVVPMDANFMIRSLAADKKTETSRLTKKHQRVFFLKRRRGMTTTVQKRGGSTTYMHISYIVDLYIYICMGSRGT